MTAAQWIGRVREYVTTVYANDLFELAIFLALVSLWFFGRHVALGWYARRLRRSLALVLGGWGTRGKSGTERLKAGLMNAVGPSIVSKTTGCEAMFLMGAPFGGLTEMFLFRPYDKATIWEQFNLMRTSRGLKARVFLWECMGLNPSYVRVLQRDWMQDDIATITNTYPDHEDVQGPAGRNIPEVMCEFIPERSRLLTTEEEMLPILEEGAAARETSMRTVGWKEAGLLHKDLLARFPYEEHPYNIALVNAMGDELGLPQDFCIREQADRVVADLGVLKTYPRARVDGRTLEFVMGMSANERFGAMGNWTRMEFDLHDIARDPGVFVSTIVNNRADRVPRSRVFARMLVRDIAADRHVLIGSNVDGLLGFIEEEWDAYVATLTLFDADKDPADRLAQLARRQRIALDQASLDGLLAAMLGPDADIGSDASAGIEYGDAIARHHQAMSDFTRRYTALAQKLDKGDRVALDTEMRELLTEAFMVKLLPVHDVHTKGEQIIRLIAETTPPGLTNRIMGMQNIKGTGLDWVYRWQAWEQVHTACQRLRSGDPGEIEQGYRTLAGFHEFGVLAKQEMREAVAAARRSLATVPGLTETQLDALEARCAEQIASQHKGGDTELRATRLGKIRDDVLARIEGFVDPSDAVRRRRKSERIYKALIAEQISSQRAAAELKELTARQKGGWLKAGFKRAA